MARLESLIELLDRSKKRIAIAFGVALLLHLPMTPAVPVLRMVHRLSSNRTSPVSNQEPPKPREVEIELQQAVRQEELRKEQLAQPEAPHAPNVSAAPPPAAVKFAEAAPTPKQESDKPKEPKKEKVKDVGLEGLASKIIGKPGVTLGIWLSSLRDNPLGRRLAEIAACDREWKLFVDQGVDLINDFDGALVVGPGLFEPKQMTVAIRHSLPRERVRTIMDGLVRQSGESGRWVAPDVATARLGRVQRMLIPQQSDLFFVAPNQGWEALHEVKEPLRVPTSEGRLASLVLAPPQKALARAGLSLPQRISELRLELFANPDESVDVRVELTDATPEAAIADVRRISSQLHDFFADVWATATTLGRITGSNSGDDTKELAPRLDLTVDEQTLTGLIHLSPSQTRTTMALASSILCRRAKRSKAAVNR